MKISLTYVDFEKALMHVDFEKVYALKYIEFLESI